MSALYRLAVTAFALAILANGGVSFGQTGSLNPNPLQPSGVGSRSRSDIDIDISPSGAGRTGIGRGVGPDGTLDENPADTLLNEIYGTNRGRRTGSFVFKDPRRQTAGYRGVAPKFEGGAVRFDRRGTYEEAIYGSRPGSYSTAGKTTRRSR